MHNVGNHGLMCPDPDDYAAVALYMQNLGTIIDGQLQTQLDALNGFQERPTIIVTNSAAPSITDSIPYTVLFDTVVFNNSAFLSLDLGGGLGGGNIIRIGSEAGAPTTVPYLQGSYSIGCTTTESATGAVTPFTERSVFITVSDTTIAPTQIVGSAFDITWDSNTGGSEAQVVKFSVLLTRTSGIMVENQVMHGNVGSTVNYPTGALWWVTYNGPTDIIEVA